MTENTYDLVVIGSGPGGYTGAIRAAQLGLKTVIIEKEKTLGGTCLNVGCIPSKALLESSELFSAAQHELQDHGVKVTEVTLDLQTMMERKNGIVDDLTKGIEYLMKKNKIEVVKGSGCLKSPTSVEVTDADGGKRLLEGKNILLATGSVPIQLPNVAFDETTIISSTGALILDRVPQKMIVVGAGVIGLELGSVWNRLGSEVTVIEFADHIGGPMDLKLGKLFQRILKKQGMDFKLESQVTGISKTDSGAVVELEPVAGGEGQALEADVVLVCVGRRPYAQGLGLETVGIKQDSRGCVEVNDHLQTSVPTIWAIGDLIRGPMLAHKAEEEGVAVAETLGGGKGHVNYQTVPSVIYTWPEVAWVGMTEKEAQEKGYAVNIGTFPFAANGRAKSIGMTEGQAKILADAKTDRILGAHILGPRASDMLAELVVAMEFAGSSEDVARSFHAHPTLSEIVREAALAVDKRARQS